MLHIVLRIVDLVTAPIRKREEERLRALRERHHRWDRVPYGKTVQVRTQRFITDPPVGTVGRVRTEHEHGIEHHPGYSAVTPDFPGIPGYHVRVLFGASEIVLGLGELAPA